MKTSNQIRGIFFDAGDTLFKARESIGSLYCQMAEQYGVIVNADRLDQRFKSAFKKSRPLSFPGASHKELPRLEMDWWRKIVQFVFEGIDFPQFDRFFRELYAFFERKDTWDLFSETKGVLKKLKEAQYTLGIISNFDSRLLPICEQLRIRDYFDIIVFSSHEECAKPGAAIFNRSLERSGLLASESMFIGDHLENDLQGAKAVGMTALLLDRVGRYSERPELNPISDLHEIDRFLKDR